MDPASDAPHLLRLGSWSAAREHDGLPEDVRRAARYQVLDMIAAARAGGRSAETAPVLEGAGAFGGGSATALATGARLSPADAAFVNAACSMAQDFDDVVWMGHPCHSAVFASLAVAEAEGASGKELVTAVAVANELGGRLGASSLLGPLNGQMWTFIHLVSAAAATAKLLRLGEEETAHALAIALAQPGFALQPAFMAPTSKLLSASTPTATGIRAAYLARAGMTGALDILEDRRGFWRRFSYLPLPEMLGELGELWVMRTLAIKTYPGCHYFQTACSALEEVLSRTGPIAPEDVAAVRVETTKLGCEATKFAGDYGGGPDRISPVNANFDLATTVSIRLAAGELTPAQVEPAWLEENAARVRRFRERVTVRHDPALTGRVIEGALALGAGRAAMRSIHLRDLRPLARRYREEYGSTLLTPREAIGWLRWGLRRGARRARDGGGRGGAAPLEFPNRVTVELRSGAVESARVDLPVGSLYAGGVERELEAKFLREVGASLGEEAARRAFAAGLELERHDAGQLARLASGRPR